MLRILFCSITLLATLTCCSVEAADIFGARRYPSGNTFNLTTGDAHVGLQSEYNMARSVIDADGIQEDVLAEGYVHDWVFTGGFYRYTPTRKALDPLQAPQIAVERVAPEGESLGGWANVPWTLNFSDGTPPVPTNAELQNAGQDAWEIWNLNPDYVAPDGTADPENPIGWSIAAPAGTDAKTLWFFGGGYKADFKVTARIVEGDTVTAEWTDGVNSSGNPIDYFGLTYQADSEDAQLDVLMQWNGSNWDPPKADNFGSVRLSGVLLTDDKPLYLLGDFDGNGAVNGLDIPGFKDALADPDAWNAANPGRSANALGDFDGNGVMNGLDIPGFKDALAGTAVPEPASLTVLGLLAAATVVRRRRR